MDSPGIPGCHQLAAKLDNLIFVVNCNLQRLDGPVRGNGKIVQELEGEFRGGGWNVIKLLWGTAAGRCCAATKQAWLKQAHDGLYRRRYQAFKANDGAFVRKNFFGRYPRRSDGVGTCPTKKCSMAAPRPRSAKVYAAFPRPPMRTRGPAGRCCWVQDRQGLWHGQDR